MKTLSLDYTFEKESGALALISASEKHFEEQLKLCAQRLLDSGVRIAALSGPSCSGKTTASNKLTEHFEAAGKRIHVVSIDNFYYDRDILIERSRTKGGKIDFDSPSTINFAYLKECFDKIVNRQTVDLPIFDFKIGRADKHERVCPDEVDLFLFEGIQALYDEFYEIIKDIPHLTVFISPESKIKIGAELFRPQDIRLSRRIVRDSLDRITDASFTLELWKGVRENEEIHIFPNKHNADIILDSTLAYEPCVFKERLVALLLGVSAEDENYSEIEMLIKKYYGVPALSEELVPEGSVFKEFI